MQKATSRPGGRWKTVKEIALKPGQVMNVLPGPPVTIVIREQVSDLPSNETPRRRTFSR